MVRTQLPERRSIVRVGHRGAAAYAPHNTLKSFHLALEMGVDMIETDVRACASGQIVLAHDAELRGVDGRTLLVRSNPLTALRDLDLGGGERAVLLSEFLDLCRGRCAVMPDLKEEGFEAALVDNILRSGPPLEHVVIPGGSAISRQRIHELNPRVLLSLTLDRPPPEGLTDVFLDGITTPAVTWHHSILSHETVSRLHAREKTVYAWTVDDPALTNRLIADGVDGIITNRPDVLNGILSVAL